MYMQDWNCDTFTQTHSLTCERETYVYMYLDVDEMLCLGDHLAVSVLDRRLRVADSRRPVTRAAQNLTTQSRHVHVYMYLHARTVHVLSSLIPSSYTHTRSNYLQHATRV